MKKIMVFNIPADNGGALTILNQYYAFAQKEKDTEWIFIISTPDLKQENNIKVLKYPWTKKSWFHRLFFDLFVAKKIIEKYQPKEVLSLQNVIVPRVKQKQILYLHQSLPFAKKRYGIAENLKLWVYQNLISKMIFKSIKEADNIIVQTKWMRDAAIEKTGVAKDKFIIKQPSLNIEAKNKYIESYLEEKLFFYPASGLIYKNHILIVKACSLLKNKGMRNYRVVFTLNGDENKDIKNLHKTVKDENLPIDFIGSIEINVVYKYYSKSTLIFPSYIETFGLPLLEAKEHNTPILASDCAFSKEVLEGYDRVEYFDPFDEKQLSSKMLKIIK